MEWNFVGLKFTRDKGIIDFEMLQEEAIETSKSNNVKKSGGHDCRYRKIYIYICCFKFL